MLFNRAVILREKRTQRTLVGDDGDTLETHLLFMLDGLEADDLAAIVGGATATAAADDLARLPKPPTGKAKGAFTINCDLGKIGKQIYRLEGVEGVDATERVDFTADVVSGVKFRISRGGGRIFYWTVAAKLTPDQSQTLERYCKARELSLSTEPVAGDEVALFGLQGELVLAGGVEGEEANP